MDSGIARRTFLTWDERSTEAGLRLRSNRFTWLLLVALLVFAPLAYGAVEFWSIAIVEVLALTLAFSWILGCISREEIHLTLSSLFWSAIGLQVWIVLQLIFGVPLDRASTRECLLLLFSYFLVFLIVSNEHWSQRWIRRLATAIAVLGFGVATFGIVQALSWNGSLYWTRAIYVGAPFGPYVNRNHFAGLMEMTFPVALGLVFTPSLGRAWKAILMFSGVVMALATFMSLSRGGAIGVGLSLLVFAYVLSRRYGTKPVIITAGLIGALAVGWLIWLGAEPFLQRVLTLPGLGQEASYDDRIFIARATLRIIQDHPYTGTGLGTFELVSPAYVSWPGKLVYDKAHNDYLQLLSEVGLIGFTFAVFWIAGLFRSFLSMVKHNGEPFSTLRLGAFCGCFALLLHSFVDFNLQIPANALFFAVLASLATRPDATAWGDRPSANGLRSEGESPY